MPSERNFDATRRIAHNVARVRGATERTGAYRRPILHAGVPDSRQIYKRSCRMMRPSWRWRNAK